MRRVAPSPATGRAAVLAAVLLASTSLAACGGAAEPDGASGRVLDEALDHVHGVAETRGTLYVATHDGLFSAPSGSTELSRIGDDRKDLMGFTAVGERFIASGHPDLRDELPPLLGVIASEDRGRSWKPVALTGEADFHVLRAAGDRIYGFDGSQARLMVSDDGGARWRSRGAAPPLFDLAIDPARPSRIVAATERGLYVSTDAGGRWRLAAPGEAGLLVWPRGGRLMLVQADGRVRQADASLRRWRTVGSLDAAPVATSAAGPDILVATDAPAVLRSADGGRTWSVRARS